MNQLRANTTPTELEIEREVMFLDGYGMTVSPIILNHAISQRKPLREEHTLLVEVGSALSQDGWAFGGAGFFSMVFVKDGLALKIGVKQDDTGAMFAAWCRANQGRAGVPTIYGITKFTGCYLVLMRRYDPVPHGLLRTGSRAPALRTEFIQMKTALSLGESRNPDYSDTVKTAGMIGEFFKGVADTDLHEGNVMMDSQGELVIIDPISFGPCSSTQAYQNDDEYSYYSDPSVGITLTSF